MLLGLHKNLSFNSGKVYPYATGGDYVYLYEDPTTGKTYRVHEFLSTGTSTLNVEVGGQMDILVVGGGGGGGRRESGGAGGGGGGGGGAFIEHTIALAAGDYEATIGGGGAGSSDANLAGSSGSASSFINNTGTTISITATGGGGGAGYGGVSTSDPLVGGSGGGGGQSLSGAGAAADTYSGTGTKYGNAGGSGTPGVSDDSNTRAGGGGGGAGAAGGNATSGVGGTGGNGRQWLDGSTYAGGGGGGAPTAGSGGSGGGGAGSTNGNATAGSANTGGGGGGARSGTGGAGGSGIVIVRYVVAEKTLWTPSELSSIKAWYKADSLSLSDGDPVSTWTDSSGNGYDITQTNTSRPTYKTSTLNGLSVVEFDGTDDYLELGSSSNISQNIGGITIYAMLCYDESQNNRYPVWISTGSGTTRAGLIVLSGGLPRLGGRRLDSDLFQAVDANTAVGINEFFIQGAVFAYSVAKLSQYINGTIDPAQASFQTSGNTSNTSPTYFSIGSAASNPSNFAAATKIGEVVLVHEALSTTDRQKLEGYLAHKWGLTNNLPSGHPYKYEPPYKVEPEEIVTDGLVLNLDAGDYASYPRSGTTWYDISGSGNNGTLTNGPTYNSANKGSIVFDGVNDYVQVADNNSLDISSNNITIEVIFKNDDLPSDLHGDGLLSKGSGSNNGVYELLTINRAKYNGKFALYFRCGSVGTINFGDILLNTNTIYHAVGVMDNGIMKTYVNGIAENASLTASGNIPTSTYPITLGTREIQKNDSSSKLNGNIYVARVYNRALSPTEISQNFNALRGRYGI